MSQERRRRSVRRASASHRLLEQKTSMEDEAEATLVRVFEDRRTRNESNDWVHSQPGEEPPLMPQVPTSFEENGISTSKANLTDVALRVRALKGFGMWNKNGCKRNVLEAVAENTNDEDAVQEAKDELANPIFTTTHEDDGGIFEGVGGDKPAEQGLSEIAAAATDADRLISGAMIVDEMFHDDASSVATGYTGSVESYEPSGERLPLMVQKKKKNVGKQRFFSKCKRKLRRMFRSNMWEALRPSVLRRALRKFVFHTVLGIVPLLLIAAFLYYKLDNATPDFMQGAGASLSYWCVFVARLWLTLSLAKVTEVILVDVLALRSKTVVRIIGPAMTLFCIQAKGWPFRAVSWSLWNLLILQGDNLYQQNWLYFTGIELFSNANPGGTILTSTFYVRFLLAMAVAGVATALKRTFLALAFGKKTFRKYKARLEKLLVDVLIISEVAELSKELEHMLEEEEDEDQGKRKSPQLNHKWQSLKFDDNAKSKVSFADSDEDNGDSSSSMESKDSGQRAFVMERKSTMSSSGDMQLAVITAMLDSWQEPVNKLEREVDPSIHDILQFRKAVTFMDDRRPFSRSFGPASTRDECIQSAQDTYDRLLLVQKDDRNLSFDVLSVLGTDEDGIPNKSKINRMKRVFRPDRYNELSELAFIQSCDAVYRKLRYFRASVGNSSVIDKVLGEALDKIFFFVLFLVICTIMKFNPWALLVSLSTFIVSFAFAMGPSASKYIEGVLLIAARAPYDLGDRILIVGPDNVVNHGPRFSWFVEDINLFSTTLRFNSTNEVATVSNGSIAGSRIVNCARSPNALIFLKFKFQISMTDEKESILSEAIETYVSDNPRTWVNVIYFRSDEIDPDNMYIDYVLLVKHRKTWQDMAGINKDRAQLIKFIYKTGEKLDIHYDSPLKRVLLYRPGEECDTFDKIAPTKGHAASQKEVSMQGALEAAGIKDINM